VDHLLTFFYQPVLTFKVMQVNRIYTIFDLYEKIENLKQGEKIWVAFDELSTKEFRYLDQTYFLDCVPNNMLLFEFDQNRKAFDCINSKIKVSI
jgi:hypothetical protein